MDTAIGTVCAAVAAYLVGSVPFGYIAGRLRGVDIRKVGSGNIGATNVFRVLGKGPGVATFILDAAKGVVAVAALPRAAAAATGQPVPAWLPVLCGALVILGHACPVFLGFKGGKGVATGLGIAIGLVPHSAALGLCAWIVVFLCSRYVSAASIVAALVVGAAPWALDKPAGAGGALVPAVVTALAVAVVLKHRSNVARLIAGTENRFCFTAKQAEARKRREQGEAR